MADKNKHEKDAYTRAIGRVEADGDFRAKTLARLRAEAAENKSAPDNGIIHGKTAGSSRRFRAAVAAALAAVLLVAAASAALPALLRESGGTTTGSTPPTLYPSPREVTPQWLTDEGLSVLAVSCGSAADSAETATGSAATGIASGHTRISLLSASGPPSVTDAESRTVRLSYLAGAKLSRYISGRFVNLTTKTDGMWKAYDGVYLDLDSGETFCLSYDIIMSLLGAEGLAAAVNSALFMLSDTGDTELKAQLTTGDLTWAELIAAHPEYASGDYGFTPAEAAALRGYMADGQTDLTVFGETATQTAYNARTVYDERLRLAAGEIEILEFGANPDKCLYARRIYGVDENNPAQFSCAVCVYERATGVSRQINDETDFTDFMLLSGRTVLTDPDYERFVFATYNIYGENRAVGDRVTVYGIDGSNYPLETVTAADGHILPAVSNGGVTLSPTGTCVSFPIYGSNLTAFFNLGTVADAAAGTAPGFALEGTFVRCARSDSIIIMKSDSGEYRAYASATGRDVTRYVLGAPGDDTVALASHEYYDLVADGGSLYRVDIRTGERSRLCAAGEAYITDAALSCVYVLDRDAGHVSAYLLADGSLGYTSTLDSAFLGELSATSRLSMLLDGSGRTLVVTYFDPASVRLDRDMLAARLALLEGSYPFGDVRNLGTDAFAYTILPCIKNGDVCLSAYDSGDVNETVRDVGLLGLYLLKDDLPRCLRDDMLITEEEFYTLCEQFTALLPEYVDIEPDGTVRVPPDVIYSLFGSELNRGEHFMNEVYLPLTKPYCLDGNAGYMRSFAQVNADSLLGDTMPAADRNELAELIAARLEAACAVKFDKDYNMYVRMSYSLLISLRDAVREMASGYAALYKTDPAAARAFIADYALTVDVTDPYASLTDEERRRLEEIAGV